MFKLNKNKSSRSGGDRIAFNFSNFQVLQVPEQWDRLSISLVHGQTGKVIAKLGKASVQNGNCGWTDSLTESLSVPPEDGDSEELDEYLLKFVISMGSSKSRILGEATVNVGRYATSKTIVPVALPLSKCDYGTILQLKLQCLTPRPKFRDEHGINSNVISALADIDDIEEKSDGSHALISRGITPLSSDQRADSRTGEQSNQEPSISASGFRHKFDSNDSGKDHFSSQSCVDVPSSNQLGRQISAISENSTPSHISIHSTFSKKMTASSSQQARRREKSGRTNTAAAASSNDVISTKDLKESTQMKTEEVRAEARMWEQNAKKTAFDMESLRNELTEQSKKRESLEMELSTVRGECASFKQEILQLNSLLEESELKRKASDDNNNSEQLQKRIEDELKRYQESNVDLAEQLQKTKESNVELLSILQELEGIVETQKTEIENLTSEKLKLQDRLVNIKSGAENERTIEDPEKGEQALFECEMKWRSILSEKDEEINSLEVQISQLLKRDCSRETYDEHDEDLAQQVEFLKGELDRLESDCSELVEENMQLVVKLKEAKLVLKLKEAKNNISQFDNLHDSSSGIEALQADCRMKELEIQSFRQKKIELEDQISSLLEENSHLKEKSECEEKEKTAALQRLDEVSNELKMLHGSMESEIGANKILERQVSELERGKQDLELRLLEVERENKQLSERTLVLEGELRSLTDEKESCRLELSYSEKQIANLNDEIQRLENEMQSQKLDMKQKLQDLENRWLEVQEECEYLKKANTKLQITIENLIEECNLIQKSNADLKRQNIELNKRSTILEVQLRDAEEMFTKCSDKIDALEGELFSMVDEIDSKEATINSELELLAHDNKEHKEKLDAEEKFLNQKYSEKALEAEKLQRELVHVIDQISSLYGEKEKLTSETIVELSSLRSEKVKLECALSEILKNYVLSEEKLKSLERDSEAKITELMTTLTSSRQKEEVLAADYQKLLRVLESTRNSEAKCKSIMNDLEMKLKDSEFGRKQLAEEVSGLKQQLQKAVLLQDDVLALKNSLTEAKFENEKLRASINLLSGDHEQLKAEKSFLIQKISGTENSVKELEKCKRRKHALEEKLSRLEGDLNAREALRVEDSELKSELGRVKRANKELQRKIKQLEKDKDEILKKSSLPMSSDQEWQLWGLSGRPTEKERTDLKSRIQVLEHELSEAHEAIDMYKEQLKRFLSAESTPLGTPKVSGNQNGTTANENAVFLLEMELRDLRERYFQMSLKYADVEAEREQLVAKLKASNNKRRWF